MEEEEEEEERTEWMEGEQHKRTQVTLSSIQISNPTGHCCPLPSPPHTIRELLVILILKHGSSCDQLLLPQEGRALCHHNVKVLLD